MQPSKRESGLTLLEVAVATSILLFVVGATLAPILGSFRLSRDSRAQLNANVIAQRTVETIRGQWQDPDRYARGCVNGNVIPGGASVTVTPLNSEGLLDAGAIGAALRTTCNASQSKNDAPLKRVTVRVPIQQPGRTSSATVTVDIARSR